MRRLERWLHQHIFKVGWLVTKDLRTTTILYYLLFLPGVVVHEVTLWLVAGMLNVRAERAIGWPETQAMAELRLNFVKLAKNAGGLKTAIIGISPLILGISLIYLIAVTIMDVPTFLSTLRDGGLEMLGLAVRQVTSTPDFFLWVYLIFAIGNTMMPDPKNLRSWRLVLIVSAVVLVVLYAVGIGEALLTNGLAEPISGSLNTLSITFATIIAIGILVTVLLGTFEAVYERITGDSATFQNGKLIALRRDEVVRQKKEAQARAARASERDKAAAGKRTGTGAPSIYSLALPIPGAPSRDGEPVVEPQRVVSATEPLAEADSRAGASLISGKATLISSNPDDSDLDDEVPTEI